MRKKSGKKGKKKKTNENDVMHNVDKAFYELQITDLNRKLARLRERVTDLEETNFQLENKFGKMDEDRGDIICYLKRNLTERNTEVADLQSKIANLTEQNALQEENHEAQMEACREEYNNMQEHLTSKIKMLTGQLNALDDYRMHREELMQKFEDVQKEFDAQELKFRKQIYEMEKKAVVDKANLKREMEERMFGLASKFQEANQVRIAATSQRIVRENIAINNEMNSLINSTNSLDYENLLIRKQFRKVVADYQLLEEGNKKTIREFSLQAGVIRELTDVNLKLKNIIDKYETALQRSLEDKRKLNELLSNEHIFCIKIKELENRLNAARYSKRDLQTQLSAENKFRHHLELLIEDARLLIQSSLFEYPELHQKAEIPDQGNLFTNVINLLTYSKSDVLPPSPYGTVSSVSLVFPTSDFRLPIIETKPPVRKVNAATYLGASFEDFTKQLDVKSDTIETISTKSTTLIDYIANGSEESTWSSSSDEQTSATYDEADGGSQGKTTVSPTEYVCNEMEGENIEEESIEEEKENEESEKNY